MADQKRRVAALLRDRSQCDHCDYEAYERSRKPKTAEQLRKQRDRNHSLERARKLCACLSCAPGGKRESLITSEGCLCKNSQDRDAQVTIRLNCVHRLCADEHWDCKAQKYNCPKQHTPPPPTASMLLLQQRRFSEALYEHCPQPTPKQRRYSRSRSRSQMRNRSQGATEVSVASSSNYNRADAIQTNWETVRAVLSPQVLQLERTISEVRWALADTNTTIRLTAKKDWWLHVFEVIESLPRDMRFKIGITCALEHRFETAHYAYSMPNTHAKDGVVYEGWILACVDHQRRVIAMAEHCLIKAFTTLEIPGITKGRCANRLQIFDDHIDCDQSDDERSDSPGPHWLYIAFGKWCHAIRP